VGLGEVTECTQPYSPTTAQEGCPSPCDRQRGRQATPRVSLGGVRLTLVAVVTVVSVAVHGPVNRPAGLRLPRLFVSASLIKWPQLQLCVQARLRNRVARAASLAGRLRGLEYFRSLLVAAAHLGVVVVAAVVGGCSMPGPLRAQLLKAGGKRA
jgi:hypothetical protein